MRAAVLSLLFLLILVPDAMAHKLNIFAIEEGANSIRTESYFLDGKPCMHCDILVFTPTAKIPLKKSETNAEGVYNLHNTEYKALLFEVVASTGHSAKYLWRPEAETSLPNSDNVPEIITPEASAISTEEIEALIESRVAPLRQEIIRLNKESERPGITEILGGIGYIIGLFGLSAYFKGRK